MKGFFFYILHLPGQGFVWVETY